MTSTEFAEFVNLRFGTFIEDIIRFFSTEPEDEGYLMLKTYTIIYEKPLVKDPKISQNIFEYLAFLPALIKMRNYTIEKVNNIF